MLPPKYAQRLCPTSRPALRPPMVRRDFSEKRVHKPSPLSYCGDSFNTAVNVPYKCEWVPVELHHESDVPPSPPPVPPQKSVSRKTRCARMVYFMLALVLLGITWSAGLRLQIEDTIRNGHSTARTMLRTPVGKVDSLAVHGSINNLPSIKMVEREGRVLVVYSYTESKPGALQNAGYFIDNAIDTRNGNADYIFVINGDAPLLLPKLSASIKVVHRKKKKCSHGFKAYVDGIQSLSINSGNDVDGATNVELRRRSSSLDEYAKFIFLDDSVKGPFYKSSAGRKWTDAYTSNLNAQTRLQGVTYHCGGGQLFIDPSLFATDRVGVSILLEKGSLTPEDFGEVGYGSSIYTMGVRGVRRRAGTNVRYCMDKMRLVGDRGVAYRPYETMFVKVRDVRRVLGGRTEEGMAVLEVY